MTAHKPSAHAALQAALANPFEAWTSMMGAGGQTGSGLGFIQAQMRAGLEAQALLSRRAQAWMNVPTRLTQCRSVQDLATEQTRFWQTAFEDYNRSWTTIMGLWSTVPGAAAASDSKAPARDVITFNEPAPSANPSTGSNPGSRRAA